ncbi:MAG: deoxyribose-phosphate aldolase [Anaerolineae bacterium]|nr:deoxyribose-phosphate aldolase [Anaerolineae bacterium]
MDRPEITREQFARMIDHSILKPTMTREDTIKGVEYALAAGVASATIMPCYTRLAAEILKGSLVMVNPVICFPLGYDTTEVKAAATRQAIDEGADEIDMVMNVSAFLGGEYDFVQNDIAAVVKAAQGAPVKVILETGYLVDDEKITRACQLCEAGGAAFVKTSSGFAPSPWKSEAGDTVGYTLDILRLMRASVSDKVQVKAAQGVRSLKEGLDALAAGATRFGVSRTDKVLAEWDAAFGAGG